MKAKDWQNTAKLLRERQSYAATADTSKLSSLSLSELPVDESRPPTVLQGPYVPLSTSTLVCVPQDNQQTMDSAQDESPFQQVIPNIPQQSLYPSLATQGTSLNTSVSPPIPFSRRVTNDIEEQERKALKDTVEGTVKWTNTSPTSDLEEQDEEVTGPNIKLQARITQADTQGETLQPESLEKEDTSIKQVYTLGHQNAGPTQAQNTGDIDETTAQDIIGSQIQDDGTNPKINDDEYISEDQDPVIPDDQTSKASQDDNYCTAIDDDDLDDTVQFGNKCFKIILHAYPPPSQADAHSQIQEMAQRLDMYLNRYPAQYINCMTSDTEFVAFGNHAIQLALVLTAYPNISAVLLILLETQDVNTSYVQVMHDYYNEYYNTKTEEYMIVPEQAREKSKNNMYNITLKGVSPYIQQPVCDP